MDDTRAKQNVVFSVLVLLFNALSLALITTSPFLRKLSKFHIIASMSTANILGCLAFFPADTHYVLYEASFSDGNLSIILHCIHTYCMPSVLSLSLVCLGVDFMVNKVYDIRLRKRIITSVISIIMSWIFGLLSLLPFSYCQHAANTSRDSPDSLLFGHNSVGNIYSNTTVKLAMLHIQQYTRNGQILLTLMTFLWGILPLILAFLTSKFCVIRHLIKKPFSACMSQDSSSLRYDTEDHTREISILDTVVSTVFVIVLTVPFYVESLTTISCTSNKECLVKGGQNRSSELARWSVAFTLPALWMIDADFREAFILFCGRIGFASCVVNY